MAKKDKQKKPRCPTCDKKLVKVRNQDQRYCRECGHTEPLVQEAAVQEQILKPPKPKGDFINRGMMSLPKVTVYCWHRGVTQGYRYGLQCPYGNPVWKKEMSGVEAFQFLTKVKRANRHNKLESGGIIEQN